MRIHAVLPSSRANGPGLLFVVWFQGCSRKCPGCCNPDTWDPRGGREESVETLACLIRRAEGITGVALSGGEPLDQSESMVQLVEHVAEKRPDLTWTLFTGYNAWDAKVADLPIRSKFDLIVSGPYRADQPRREDDPPLLASRNQQLSFPSGRWSLVDLMSVPEVEFVLHEDGILVRTGIGAGLDVP